jgi:hypothetical protein
MTNRIPVNVVRVIMTDRDGRYVTTDIDKSYLEPPSALHRDVLMRVVEELARAYADPT